MQLENTTTQNYRKNNSVKIDSSAPQNSESFIINDRWHSTLIKKNIKHTVVSFDVSECSSPTVLPTREENASFKNMTANREKINVNRECSIDFITKY